MYDLYKEYMINNHLGGRVDNSIRFFIKLAKIYEKTRTNKQRGYIIKYLNEEELNMNEGVSDIKKGDFLLVQFYKSEPEIPFDLP